jgi:predicted nucleic acid-binding protein
MLIDTSGFFSLYSEEDEHHASASEIFRETSRRTTTNYVLAEYVALALVRRLPRAQVLSFSEEVLDDQSVEIVWVSEDLHRRGVELLQQRPDKTYSLCDAVSFVLMSERGETEALTTDRHFEQEGFVRLLAP